MSGENAFSRWAPESLDSLPLMPAATMAPLAQLTAGLPALLEDLGAGDRAVEAEDPPGGWTMPDGRLRLGTHLPLLARRYRYLSPIGEGVSAQVLLVGDELRPEGPPLVLKVMKRTLAYAGQKEARALRHLSVASPAATRHSVALRGTFTFKGHFCLVQERLHGTLLEWIVDTASSPPAAHLASVRKLAHQLLSGLAGIHACGIVHADLKPENILLKRPSGGGTGGAGIKIADFGSCFSEASVDTGRLSFEVQTLSYRAPEAVTGAQALGRPADVWSAACILVEAALRRPLFPAHSPSELLRQIEATLQPEDPKSSNGSTAWQRSLASPAAASTHVSARQLPSWHEVALPLYRELAVLDRGLADLVSKLLLVLPASRLTAEAALRHPFLTPLCPLHAPAVAPRPPSPRPLPPPAVTVQPTRPLPLKAAPAGAARPASAADSRASQPSVASVGAQRPPRLGSLRGPVRMAAPPSIQRQGLDVAAAAVPADGATAAEAGVTPTDVIVLTDDSSVLLRGPLHHAHRQAASVPEQLASASGRLHLPEPAQSSAQRQDVRDGLEVLGTAADAAAAAAYHNPQPLTPGQHGESPAPSPGRGGKPSPLSGSLSGRGSGVRQPGSGKRHCSSDGRRRSSTTPQAASEPRQASAATWRQLADLIAQVDPYDAGDMDDPRPPPLPALPAGDISRDSGDAGASNAQGRQQSVASGSIRKPKQQQQQQQQQQQPQQPLEEALLSSAAAPLAEAGDGGDAQHSSSAAASDASLLRAASPARQQLGSRQRSNKRPKPGGKRSRSEASPAADSASQGTAAKWPAARTDAAARQANGRFAPGLGSNAATRSSGSLPDRGAEDLRQADHTASPMAPAQRRPNVAEEGRTSGGECEAVGSPAAAEAGVPDQRQDAGSRKEAAAGVAEAHTPAAGRRKGKGGHSGGSATVSGVGPDTTERRLRDRRATHNDKPWWERT